MPSTTTGKKTSDLNMTTAILGGILIAMVILWTVNFQALEAIQQHSLFHEHPIQTAHRKTSATSLNNETKHHPSTKSLPQTQSPYAYVWVIGGIREDSYGYKGFLWDVLISANLLRKLGSKADFYIYVRLSPTSNLDDLPLEDRRLLEALGIRIILLEKPQHESFGQLVFDKFLTINMTDYKRVMFLDADVVPLVNLDYMFHLSDPDYTDLPTLLRPNVITASLREPCNTGMFMVEPSKEGFEQYQDAVKRQRERAKHLPYPHFDMEEGWGHSFVKHKEFWQAVTKRGNRWHFHAAHSDQGLMLYWAKYLRQDVTILISDVAQNWKPGDNDGEPIMESESEGILDSYQGEPLRYQWSCNHLDQADNEDQSNAWRCHAPFDGMAHFMGKTKPWQRQWRPYRKSTASYRQRAAKYLWFDELVEINEKLQMGLDMKHWDSKYPNLLKDTSLGYVAKFQDQAEILGIREEKEKEEELEGENRPLESGEDNDIMAENSSSRYW
jgi:Alpha-N-acetylglucosamine transferase